MGELTVEVPAGAGHVMAQLAACRGSVGVALIGAPMVADLHGSPAALAALARSMEVDGPEPGASRESSWGWWQPVGPFRALVIADPTRHVEFETCLDRALARAADVARADLGNACAAVVLAGPASTRLAASAVVALADPVAVVCAGEDYRLILLRRSQVHHAHRALLEAGRCHHAVAVGPAATVLYRSAQRTLRGQLAPGQQPPSAQRPLRGQLAPGQQPSSVHLTTTGVPIP